MQQSKKTDRTGAAPIFRDVPQCLSPKVDHSSASVARSVRRYCRQEYDV